ncbi:MAG TPA: hypothetical protein VGK30_00290 [Candidatus Binatia bacterium]|jgi:hypothetical protein
MAARHAGAIAVALALALASAAPGRTAGAPPCDCARFADELATARALYRSRGEGATLNPTEAARQRFRERVLGAFERARCLVECMALSDHDRDEARGFLGMVGFKSRSLGPTSEAARARVDRAFEESTHCLAHEPAPPACHLAHGSIRGVLAEGSWNPMQIKLPSELLVDFRAARAGAAPGSDPPNGAATRAEATLLMRAPRIAGGDGAAAVRLMEEATRSPLYPCTVDNRLVYAEALARAGTPARALAELRAGLAAGLPSCGDDRYENAVDLAQAARCVARLESHPDKDPGWSDDCE